MRFKTLLGTALTLLVFTGCATDSTLSYDKSRINLRVDNAALQVHGKEVKSNRENFSILFLDQKLIRLDDGSLVMYEHGETDLTYEFAQLTPRTISHVFDAEQIIPVFSKAFLYVYQLVLTDGRVLNVVVSQSFDQEITMVYGMSSEKLDKMIHRLNLLAKPVPYRNAVTLEHELNPLLSRWTTWKINFVPLVQPLPRGLRM